MRTQGACGRKGPCDRSLVEAPPCCTAARPCFQPRAIVATQGPAPGVHHVACGRVVSCRVLFCCTTPHGFAFHSAIPKRGARASYSQNAGAEAWPDAHAASFSAPTLSALLLLESAARGIQDRPPTRCRPTRQGKRGRGNVRGSGRAGREEGGCGCLVVAFFATAFATASPAAIHTTRGIRERGG